MGGIRKFLPARHVAAFAAVAFCALGATAAQAQGRATSTVNVVLKVQHNCNLQTNTLNFGVVDGKTTSVTGSTTMRIVCTPGTVYTVGIDNGGHWDGTTRRMWSSQANGQVFYADYELYRDPLRQLRWGTGLFGATGVLLTGSQTLTVYGRAQLKNVRPAPYKDTVTVTLDF